MKEDKLIYKQFRDHEDVMGETKTAMLALDALIDSIKELKCTSKEFDEQINELFTIIKNSEPRIMPLINIVEVIEHKHYLIKKKTVAEKKKELISHLLKSKKVCQDMMNKVVAAAAASIKKGDFIVVHSASSVVLNSLIEAKERGKQFKVLVLKQDPVKTTKIIDTLHKHHIPSVVLPENNLVHIIDETTKIFLGATTLTSDQKVVAAVGTTSIVGIAHLHDIPIYLLMHSLKFSPEKCEDQQIHTKKQKKKQDTFAYSFMQFSHDKIQLRFINHIVTEKGVMNAKKLKKFHPELKI